MTPNPEWLTVLRGIFEPIFAHGHEVERAQRKTCRFCQFESNRYYESHAPGCPRYIARRYGD